MTFGSVAQEIKESVVFWHRTFLIAYNACQVILSTGIFVMVKLHTLETHLY